MSGKVSNADLFKLVTQLQEDLKTKYENLERSNADGNKVLSDKIDSFNDRLNQIDRRLDTIDASLLDQSKTFVDIETKIDEVDSKTTESLTSVLNRVSKLESQLLSLEAQDLPAEITKLRLENEKLREELENRTNRQMRRTLVFRNIPEQKDDESYSEVKALLADVISSDTEISREECFNGIERAHRESKRNGASRQGKRKIFVAFLNWELPQRILDLFKKKCISDSSFDVYVDQMYGPLTTRRRNLAFQKRKSLKENGVITSGYVAFPARLMVNFPNEYDVNGKKLYKVHANFSEHEVEDL